MPHMMRVQNGLSDPECLLNTSLRVALDSPLRPEQGLPADKQGIAGNDLLSR